MKKLSVILATLVLAAVVATPALAAIEVSGSAYVGYFDKYLWRGYNLSGSQPVVQGGVNLSAGGATLGVWTNVQASSDDGFNSGEATETDFSLDYTHAINDMVSVSVGNIYYTFDSAEYPDTNELYLGVALGTLLSPTFKVYYDWDECDENGLFYTAAISHSFDVMEKLSVGVGALVSYNDESDYAVGNYSDWHNYELNASATYALTDQISIVASVLYSDPISDEAEANFEDDMLGGLTVSFSF